MKPARVLFRGTRLSAVTLVAFLALMAGQLFLLPLPGNSSRRARWRQRVARRWSSAVCRALAVRVEVEGEPPRTAGFLVANHLGYLDIVVLGSVLDTVFVSRADLADWPVIGFLATRAGTIYLERERKRALLSVNQRIQAALAAGGGVVVFPEGTSSGGQRVLPFRPSLLAPAADLGLPVCYAALSYATHAGDPAASKAVCWWGEMPFGPHVLGLLGLRGVRARVAFGAQTVKSSDRKELARKLWQGVSVAITPPA